MIRVLNAAPGYRRGYWGRAAYGDPEIVVLPARGLRLRLEAPDGVWQIDMEEGDCARIAEAIGWQRPGNWP